MLPATINLALVDDHALFRKTLKNFLSEQNGLSVVLHASTIYELLGKLENSSVDVLVMDIFMPLMNGNEAVKTIRSEYPDIKILVLSMCTDVNLISDLLDEGIHGFISKSDEPEDLLKAIHALSSGRIYRSRLFTEALYFNRQKNTNPFANEPLAILTDREQKILQLIWEEKSNKEIADELFLGIRSVEKIRQDIKEKIGVKSTVGLLKYALNKKIIALVSRNPDLIRQIK